MAARTGRQTPVCAVVLPYTNSHGTEAVELYDKSGRTAMDWQKLLLEDIMAVNDEGLWVHMKFGWSIPRRNGKSEVLIMRIVYAVTHGEKALYTAHRTTTSHNAWEKVVSILGKAGFVEGEDFRTTKQFGLEHIEWLSGDGVVNFRTRSSKGGLGEGYDLLVIDEAQEYTTDQESALKYLVTASPNPQTLLCGTPPTVVSSGTVFLEYRKTTLTGKNEDCGWAEWSVPQMSDPHDVELWYETNPSLGTILTERTIRSELGEDNVDANIQRLGLWLQYSQKSAISKTEWCAFTLPNKPELPPKSRLFYAVKFAQKTGNAVLAVAVKTADERIFVEAIDCRPIRDGNQWMMPWLRANSAAKVAIDGAGNAPVLVRDLHDAQVSCKAIQPKVAEVVAANALFERNLFEGKICHANQPSLTQAISNCEHRPIGSGGGYGYNVILEGAESALIEAVSLAHWLCATAKPHRAQIIGY